MVGGQLAERQMFHYPPYYRLVYVYLKNHNEAAIIAVGMVLLGVIIKWGINDFIDKERIMGFI